MHKAIQSIFTKFTFFDIFREIKRALNHLVAKVSNERAYLWKMCCTLKYDPHKISNIYKVSISTDFKTSAYRNLTSPLYFDWGNAKRSGNGAHSHCFFRREKNIFYSTLLFFTALIISKGLPDLALEFEHIYLHLTFEMPQIWP